MTDNVIQIGELLIRRRQEKHTYLKDERCHHRNMTWDDNGQIVTCDACGIQLSPYWALHQLAFYYEKEMTKVKARAEQLEQDKAHNLHLIAAKKVESVWRSRSMAPCCPHCPMNYYSEWDTYAAQWIRNLIDAGLIPPGHVDTRSITDVQPSDLAGYRQCHFFAGIAGWSLAARLAGWPDDRELWTGSAPCQPFSVAGKGEAQDDDRHLWPHFLRLIRARRPAVVMGEQVAAAVGKNWLDGVSADLEAEDYACRAIVVPACAVNAPHRRDRLWVLAHTNNPGPQGQSRDVVCTAEGRRQQAGPAAAAGVLDLATDDAVAHADGCGRAPRIPASAAARHGSAAEPSGGDDFWRSSVRITGHDAKGRRVEPSIPLLAHGIPGRVGRLRAYGNAIVAQVAAEVIGAYMDCYPEAQ